MKTERQIPYAIVAEAGCRERNWMLSGKVWVSQKKIDEVRFQTDHLDITCELTQSGKTTRQATVVRNKTDKPVTLEQVSAAYVAGIGQDGLRPWYDEERFRIHFALPVGMAKGSGEAKHCRNLDYTARHCTIRQMQSNYPLLEI